MKGDALLKARRFVITHQIFCHLFPYFFQGDFGWGLAEQKRAPIVIVTVCYLLWQSVFATIFGNKKAKLSSSVMDMDLFRKDNFYSLLLIRLLYFFLKKCKICFDSNAKQSSQFHIQWQDDHKNQTRRITARIVICLNNPVKDYDNIRQVVLLISCSTCCCQTCDKHVT